MSRVVHVAGMLASESLELAEGLWWALAPPTPLAGMPYPDATFDWTRAASVDFRTVVCLTDTEPSYDASPLRRTGVRLEDLWGGRLPSDPDAELIRVRRAVDAVVASLAQRDGVLVHCVGGRGRSGTVVGAALVTLGEDPDEVALWLNGLHRARDTPGWPESPWQREVLALFAESR